SIDAVRIGKKLYSFLLLMVLSVVGGLICAGMLVPVVSLASSASNGMADFVTSLPTSLDEWQRAERSTLTNSDGTLLATFFDENRIYKSLDEIAPVMVTAQVAIEDHRFYEHGPMDLQGTLRAFLSTSQGVTQGGSSITQQLVRSVLVLNAEAKGDKQAKTLATEQTMARKVRELRYAISVEETMTKDEILEAYLNISYYGGGAYGVEAAAQHWFGVSADQLDLAQAAMLAGLVRNPYKTDPVRFPQEGIERRNNVLDRMAELALITEAERDAAKQVPFDPTKVKEVPNGCLSSPYPFICQFAENTILKKATSLGDTEEERKLALYRGGLQITTDFDVKSQKAAQKKISSMIDPKDPVISLIGFLEPGTGRVIAMAQSRPKMGFNYKTDKAGNVVYKNGDPVEKWKGETFYNYFVSRDMGGADGFHGGSTFKMFVVAAALNEGYGVNVRFNAKSSMQFQGKTFESCDGPFEQINPWEVTGGAGVINMLSGAAGSVNTYFAQLEESVGMCEVTTMAETLGLKLAAGGSVVENYDHIPAFTLGAVEATPISMLEAYATIASGGIHCDATIISTITSSITGEELEAPDGNCKRVISKDLAAGVAKVLRGSVEHGTSRYVRVPGVQMAGKTGTVPLNRSVWQMAFTPQLVGAAMVSYDNNPRFAKYWKSKYSFLRNIVLPVSGTYISGQSGSTTGQMLQPVFATVVKRVTGGKYKNFPEPSSKIWNGDGSKLLPLPSCTGDSVGSCKSQLTAKGFSVDVEKKKKYDDSPEGTVIAMKPSGKAARYSTITLTVSKGPKPEPEPDPATVVDPNQPTQTTDPQQPEQAQQPEQQTPQTPQG
ncbi:MAG: transglycosylase domain-containing protein, partial [Propionibacteriaceae bacterium]|nr:transglycosylase domain-containing protein [Propionibacteriaceae bacterium]